MFIATLFTIVNGGGHVCIPMLIHVWQKLTQSCKAIILKFKKKYESNLSVHQQMNG